MQAIDLRSDTVTLPTEAMYARMAAAPLGDDGLDGDPTTRELEALAAALLGKAAALFVPSCTMANLLALLAQTQRTEQVIVEHGAHVYNIERGAALLNVMLRPVAGHAGAFDLDALENTLRVDGMRTRTALICLENTHNSAGGAVLPIEHLQAARRIAEHFGARLHLDGARMFNATAALGVTPQAMAEPFDTIAICLSKGLSAPAGALLVGSVETMKTARGLRKLLGGTQRQTGVFAAAGIEALTVMRLRLGEDHDRARQLSRGLAAIGRGLAINVPDSNIVQVDVSGTGLSSLDWVSLLDKAGVRTRPAGLSRLRCVTHRHIDAAAIDRAVAIFGEVAEVAVQAGH